MAGRHLRALLSRASTALAEAVDRLSCSITDDDVLEQLLADDGATAADTDSVEYAYCPRQRRTTAHTVHTDGSQSCLACAHTLNGTS